MKGVCHCGAAGWEITPDPVRATRCNCSYCRRTAVLWVYGTRSNVALWGETLSYTTGPRELAFHFCAGCGVVTHWIGTEDRGPETRVAVNARMADPVEIGGLEVRWFDGADSWTFVDGPFTPP